jgi:hypothetical protein
MKKRSLLLILSIMTLLGGCAAEVKTERGPNGRFLITVTDPQNFFENRVTEFNFQCSGTPAKCTQEKGGAR